MTLVHVADAAYPPALATLPADLFAIAGYVGGDTPHIWSADERQTYIDHGLQWWAIWTMPERRLSVFDAEQAADGMLAALRSMAYPSHLPVLLDVEQSAWSASPLAAADAIRAWKAGMNDGGYPHAFAYVPWAAQFDWVAYWTNVRPTTLPPGVIGWQYGGDVTGGIDLSVFDLEAMNMSVQSDVEAVLNKGTAPGQPDWAHTNQATLETVQGVLNLVRQLQGAVSNLAADVAKIQSGGVDPVAIAQAIAAHVKLAPQ